MAPRAACYEKRLAALVCDPGQMDFASALPQKLPAQAYELWQKRDQEGVNAFFSKAFQLNEELKFYFKSRMGAHGLTDVFSYLDEMLQYTFKDMVQEITCPTLICDHSTDTIGTRVNPMYDSLMCDKHYIAFQAEWGAGLHCEAGASASFEQKVFDWLDHKFKVPHQGTLKNFIPPVQKKICH